MHTETVTKENLLKCRARLVHEVHSQVIWEPGLTQSWKGPDVLVWETPLKQVLEAQSVAEAFFRSHQRWISVLLRSFVPLGESLCCALLSPFPVLSAGDYYYIS